MFTHDYSIYMSMNPGLEPAESFIYHPSQAAIEHDMRINRERAEQNSANVAFYNKFLESLKPILPEHLELQQYLRDKELEPLMKNQTFYGQRYGDRSGYFQSNAFMKLIHNLAKLIKNFPQDITSPLYAIHQAILVNSLLLVKEINDADIKKNSSLNCDPSNDFYWDQLGDLSFTVAAAVEVSRRPEDLENCNQLTGMINKIYNPRQNQSTVLKCLALAAATLVGLALITVSLILPVGPLAASLVVLGMASIFPGIMLHGVISDHFNQKKVQQQTLVTCNSLQALSLFAKSQKKVEDFTPEPAQENTQSFTV